MARIQPVSAQSASYDGATHEIVLEAADLTSAAGTASTWTLPTTAHSATRQSSINVISAHVQTPFDGEGTLNNLEVKIGNAAAGDQFAGVVQLAAQHASTVTRKKCVKGAVNATTGIHVTVPAVAGQANADYTKGKVVFRVIKAPEY